MEPDKVQFVLPVSVITRGDLSSLMRELDAIDKFFMDLELRPSGSSITPPHTSKKMEDLLGYNKLNILKTDDRARLRLQLQGLRLSVPILHISFSVEPTQAFLEKIIVWLRKEIHPM